jgi:hypothetical protein
MKRRTLFFMLGWDWYGFNKKSVGSHSAFWFIRSVNLQHTIFHAQVSPVQFP